jgi:hypothetical protein
MNKLTIPVVKRCMMHSFVLKAVLTLATLLAAAQMLVAAPLHSPKGAEVFASSAVPMKTVRIGWSYPLHFETPDLIFKVYHSTDLTISPVRWALLTNLPGYMRFVDLPAEKRQEFFVVTASNYLGESGFASR